MPGLMLRSDFQFELPHELIAQYPCEQRDASRLLCLDAATGLIDDRQFGDITELLQPGDLLVMNNTRVIPARLYGTKHTGGHVQVVVERILDDKTFSAQIRASKTPKPGGRIEFAHQVQVQVMGREKDLYQLKLLGEGSVMQLLEEQGHIPLPPYITREDEQTDVERYQTVYAKQPGAVAAPTAGLHFTQEILSALQEKGVQEAFVTLHVGAGTFQPVRCEKISEHHMHKEWLEVTAEVVQKIKQTKQAGGRVIAVGTTSVRCLETAALSGELESFQGDTDIFIYPGFEFKVVDALITNFHLPESTLLMLVCAFAGYNKTMDAYRHAVRKKYRFFSYGDAMFISKK